MIPRLYIVVVFFSCIVNTFFVTLGCRFSVKAYGKNVRWKATKCSLKSTEVLSGDNGYGPKFDTYQGTVAPNCFESHKNSGCPYFFQKKDLARLQVTLSNVILFLLGNLSGLKKKYFQACIQSFFSELIIKPIIYIK